MLLFENGVVLEVTKTRLAQLVAGRPFENGVVLEVTKTTVPAFFAGTIV